MAEAGVGVVPIRPDMTGFGAAVGREVDQVTKSVSQKFTDVGKGMMKTGGLMTAGLTVPVVAGFKKIFDAASDMNEVQSKSDTIFGKSAGVINKWAKGAAQDFGLSQKGALEAAGTFGNLFVQLGYSTEQATKSSTAITELAADFASFHNADITQVIEAQTAAFRGEYDALQRFVPTINAATVEQKALAMTGKTLTSELTAQEKALAVEALMLENAGDALGDFDRTSDSAANKQRILKAQFDDTAATLGQQLLPIGQQLLGWVQKLVEWFSNLSPNMQKVILGGAALLAVAGPLVTAIGALVTVVGLLISPVGLVVVAVAALVAGVIYAYKNFEGFREVVDNVVAWLKDTAWPAIKDFAQLIADKFQELVAWVRKNWGDIREAITHVLNVVEGIIRTVVGVITRLWETFGDNILRLVGVVWNQIRNIIETAVGIIQNVIELVLAVINGDWGKAWDAIKDILNLAWEFIRETIVNALDYVWQVLGIALDAIGLLWEVAWDAAKNLLAAVWDSILGKVEEAINAVESVIRWVLTTIQDIWNSIWDAVKNTLSSVWDTIKSTAATGIGFILDAFIGFVEMMLDGAAKAFSWVPVVGDKLREAADDVARFRDDVNAYIDGIKNRKDITINVEMTGWTPETLRWFRGDGPGRGGGRALSRVQGIIGAFPGAQITSTYRTPAENRRVGGSPTSYHMDRANPATDIGGPTRILDRLYAHLKRMGGWRELLWRVKGHFDHIHVAHLGGEVQRSWPSLSGLGSDERPAILQTGEYVSPRGGLESVVQRLAGLEAAMLSARPITVNDRSGNPVETARTTQLLLRM